MKWSITEMLVTNDVVPDMVTRIGFSVSDEQNGLSGQVSYAMNVNPPDPENHTPYGQVTEAQAIRWIQEALGEEGTASMELQVQAIIDGQKIPTPQAVPLPWAEAAE
jgi:hypothetical protein